MATALSNQDLRSRMRRLQELARLFSIEERPFRDCDTTIDVQLHALDRQATGLPWTTPRRSSSERELLTANYQPAPVGAREPDAGPKGGQAPSSR
jgi:hypothetical protein